MARSHRKSASPEAIGWKQSCRVILRSLLDQLHWVYRAVGAGLALAVMELLARMGHQPLVRVPFVTSIVLTIGLPNSDGARPYAVVAGHLLSCVAGFSALSCFGSGEMSSAIAVGIATLLMLACRAMHPPAGLDAFLIAWLGLPTSWILNPVAMGVVLLAGYSRVWVLGEQRLPRYLRACR